MPKPRLHAVQQVPAVKPADITALLRQDIAARDWSAVHVAADRRAPLFLADRPKRMWLR